jgi:hypothetical protein
MIKDYVDMLWIFEVRDKLRSDQQRMSVAIAKVLTLLTNEWFWLVTGERMIKLGSDIYPDIPPL